MTNMKTSKQGRDLLIARESLELDAYRDSEGYWTIGVGHLLSLDKTAVYAGLYWTREKAEAVFAEDLAKYEAAVNNSVKVKLAQHQFDALVSFAHNVGVAGVQNSWVVREINKGDFISAAANFDNWHTPTSIISRRNAEKAQFLGMAFVARLDTNPTSGVVTPSMLRLGDKGPAVVALQRELGITADGDFGRKTEAAVRAFQSSRGLYPDGVAGPVTLAALKA